MILFLDFDGVLHPECVSAVALCRRQEQGDFSCVPLFEQIMREFPQVEIVISSAWRETNPLQALRGFFSPDIAPRIVGTTPIFPVDTEARRECEIRRWLSEAGRQSEPFVAVDDCPPLFSRNCDFLFYVNPETALDDACAKALRKRLLAMTPPSAAA
ncbi:MAG TPA: HAD domain-containing protein [Paucimonas sp.]|nr:HAD domain-containing protein [Paucimonas sp.]